MHKQEPEERRGINKRVIMHFFSKTASEKNFWVVQGEFDKIIGVVRRKLCF